MRFGQPHQLALFLSAVHGEHLQAAWHLAALTGMRRGEIAALRWDDIDCDHQRLYITQTRAHIGTDTITSAHLAWASPQTVEASTMRSFHGREETSVRP